MASKRSVATAIASVDLQEIRSPPAFKRRLIGKQRLPLDPVNLDEDEELVTATIQQAATASSSSAATATTLLDHELAQEAAAFRSSVCSAAIGATPSIGHPCETLSCEEKRRSKGAPKQRTTSSDARVVQATSQQVASSQGVEAALSLQQSVVPLLTISRPSTAIAAPARNERGPLADAAAEERWFLSMGTKVVGVQHYNGVVSDRESVVLRRQPNNAYDRNAIQVLNIRNEQIGHVPREMAAVLSPMMESVARGSDAEVRFEGHIPRGAGNVFSMPLRLQVFATDPGGALAPQLRDFGERLRRTYCQAARGAVEVVTSHEEAGTPVDSLDDQAWRRIMGGRPPKNMGPQGPTLNQVIERELEGIYRSGASYEAMPEAESPPALRTYLYPHQRKALHWMRQQERHRTVEHALAEVVASSPSSASAAPSQRSRKAAQGQHDPPQVFFWTKEFLPGGGCVYKNLATNSAFRDPPCLPRGGILADDMGLGKTITTLALMLFDPPVIVQGQAGTGKNLIICPLSVLFNWAEQIRLHAPSLSVRTYYGPDRDREPTSFARHDVTLTTFDVVRAEAVACGGGGAVGRSALGGLASVPWHRVVLDEAHVIKNHRTATSKAVCETIVAERRWCLTGTPIQNGIEDIYALARFLRLEPFDHFEWFNRTIVRPFKSRDVSGFERLQVLLRTWCLRRTKDMAITDPETGASRPLLILPKKTLEIVRVPLDPGDRILYDQLVGCANQRVQEIKQSQGGLQVNQVLSILTRLRQLCCSTKLLPKELLSELSGDVGDVDRILKAATAALGSSKVNALLQNLTDAQDDDCSICLTPGCDIVTRCGHMFHRDCVEASIQELGIACPLCRQPIRKTELLEKPPELPIEGTFQSDDVGDDASAKVRAVVAFLKESVVGKRDQDLQELHKAVVFSQFTSLLNVVQKELVRQNIAFVRMDGSMSYEQRVQALRGFSSLQHVQVILCSLKACGTGLNLTTADHILLVDPWWNPAVEDQAIDRAHRLGQRRPVRALRFVAEHTVEERILEMHAQKRAITEGALTAGKTGEELRQMRLDLVASIFAPF